MNKTIDYYMALPYRMEIIPDNIEGGYTAWYPDLPGCLISAETLEGIITNADDAKRAWLEAALSEGIEISEPSPETELSGYSGQFKLRLPRSLHRALSMSAKAEGISMNQYCIYLLSKNHAAHSLRRTETI